MTEFDKTDLTKAVAARLKIDFTDAAKAMNATFDELAKAVNEQKRVEIHGFGVFIQRQNKGRKGTVQLPGQEARSFDYSNQTRKKVTFRASKKAFPTK